MFHARIRYLVPIFVLLAASSLLAITLTSRSGEGSPPPGRRILLTGPQEAGRNGASIDGLRRAGFTVVDRPETAQQLLAEDDVVAVITTREAFSSVPTAAWSALYQSGVLVGGIDVSLHELQPITSGRKAGSGRLEFNPARPIFSLLVQHEGCYFSSFSDWADNYDVAAMVKAKLEWLCSLPSGIDCGPVMTPE